MADESSKDAHKGVPPTLRGDLTLDGRPVVIPAKDSGMFKHDAVVVQRSTTDPFEINFAQVSIVDHLQSKHAGRKQRIWAWLLLVLPAATAGIGMIIAAWQLQPGETMARLTAGQYLFRFAVTVFACVVPAFWIVIMRRGGRRR